MHQAELRGALWALRLQSECDHDALRQELGEVIKDSLFEGGGVALPAYSSREGCRVEVPDWRRATARGLDPFVFDKKITM